MFRHTNAVARPLIAGCCILVHRGFHDAGAAPPPDPALPAAAVRVNRTVPKVDSPRTTLAFPLNPSAQDLFRARVFEEPLVPIGAEPSPAENTELASALLGYSKRPGPDDFSALTGFLQKHQSSPWQAALLTDLGLEYYNTAHYSRALDAWAAAWSLARDAADAKGRAIGDRAAGELAYMYARLGRMTELEALLNSVEGRVFCGPATERISGARAGLANMKDRPEVAFRCGPLALHQIKLSIDPKDGGDATIYKSASTQKGLSLSQVADLSTKIGLNYQMAFREKGAPWIFPAVVHWKVGHYAAAIRREGDRCLLQDPTFQNDVWAGEQALEDETSGYFLVPPGALPPGWRVVDTTEGQTIWGKGNVCCLDPKPNGPCDKQKGDSSSCQKKKPCQGMAVSDAHLMLVSLNLTDEPVGYSPPVGPAMDFTVRYNQREAFQPSTFTYSNLGPKWTFDWLSYITDNPLSPSADVNYFIMGGGTRTFTGFDPGTQSFGYQQFDHTRLTRTSSTSYEMVSPDGSRKIFDQPDGSPGTSRKVFLTQFIDPFGNAVSITYDSNFRVVAISDAIGQVTTLTYGNSNDIYQITRVTDPFGRFATFDYDPFGRLIKITDVIGLTSEFAYEGSSDFINALITPYGTTSFVRGESGTTRWLETIYPDGDHDRVEFNQSTTLGTPGSVPAASIPLGMATHNEYLWYRNTYYWSKIAYASTYPDYTKATIYHWLHTADGASASGILESTKEPLEGRVWYDYAGQTDPIAVGTSNKPTHEGRVLDDGTTQLYTYEYDGFGHITRMIDPVGRTFSYLYSTNGIDLLEVRQTRAGNNELLSQMIYNAHHLPLTVRDAAGQTTTFTYNARGQVLTETNPKSETTSFTRDPDGYLIKVDGPLPGTNDLNTWTYDAFGRIRTRTDVSGYTLVFDYDALDRLTKITYPDATSDQFVFTWLDMTLIRDRVGRETTFEYNSIREMTARTDPLNRVTLFQWCQCGDNKSLTDPLGRTTTWRHDIQGRVTGKEFADGSKISYAYENTTSRVSQRIDEKLQVTRYHYNRDNTLSETSYANAAVATPSVTYTYDPNYERKTSMTDGTGTTRYNYVRITGTTSLGAGQLATVDGPLPNDTITFGYDQQGRRVSTAINEIASASTFDAAGRVLYTTNALGVFGFNYEGTSFRLALQTSPNGLTAERSYTGTTQDQRLQRITHKVGIAPVSEFLYGHDAPAERITSVSQQAGAQTPSVFSFGYDAENQITLATVTNAGALVRTYAYAYDPAGNRLTERIDLATNTAAYNALNQLTATTVAGGIGGTNEWDAEQRLIAVNAGNQRTEFTYDGLGRRVSIRHLVNGSEVSDRRFLWCDDQICEERDGSGAVTKRFFDRGVKIESGPQAGSYFYTRDHLGSIRELIDSSGNIRARYSYDPFGRRTRVTGDLESDFGFAGMFVASETGHSLTRNRAYDPEIGRWLSRDPLEDAEMEEGSNLYAYVHNDVVNLRDSLGLCCEKEKDDFFKALEARDDCQRNVQNVPEDMPVNLLDLRGCRDKQKALADALDALKKCEKKPCKRKPDPPCKKPPCKPKLPCKSGK